MAQRRPSLPPELPAAVERYIMAHDGMLLANHGALTVGHELFATYYKMETIEHFAQITLVARQLGGERLFSREEVIRLQELRGKYGIAAPAPICPDPVDETAAGITCQVVEAPSAPPGERLVGGPAASAAGDAEIRLTYRELCALIEDAVRALED